MRRGIRDGIVKLEGVMTVRKKSGRLYTYFRRAGQPLIRLPDLPHDHPDFLSAYLAARKAAPEPRPKLKPGTIGALTEAAMRSEHFRSLSEVYRATLRRHFEAIRAEAGDAPSRGLRDRHVRKNVIEAASPTDRLKAWRFLATYGLEAGLLDLDPTLGVRAPKRRKTEGHPPWTADEIAAYRKRWPIGTVPRLAFELLFWTGARIGDAVRLGPGMIDREGVLKYRQNKTGDPAYVPWTCALPVFAARMAGDRAQLHDAIAASEGGHMTFLATAHGRTRSSKALGTLIRESAREAEVEKSAHGLRKARAVALSDSGATTHQIASWTGHVTLKEIEHYTRQTARRRAVMGLEQEQNGANPPAQAANSAKK